MLHGMRMYPCRISRRSAYLERTVEGSWVASTTPRTIRPALVSAPWRHMSWLPQTLRGMRGGAANVHAVHFDCMYSGCIWVTQDGPRTLAAPALALARALAPGAPRLAARASLAAAPAATAFSLALSAERSTPVSPPPAVPWPCQAQRDPKTLSPCG